MSPDYKICQFEFQSDYMTFHCQKHLDCKMYQIIEVAVEQGKEN